LDEGWILAFVGMTSYGRAGQFVISSRFLHWWTPIASVPSLRQRGRDMEGAMSVASERTVPSANLPRSRRGGDKNAK